MMGISAIDSRLKVVQTLPGGVAATLFFFADKRSKAHHRMCTAGRDIAPSGVPARLYRVGGEGTRAVLGGGQGRGNLFSRFFASSFTPSFFVASVVAPLMSLKFETNQ